MGGEVKNFTTGKIKIFLGGGGGGGGGGGVRIQSRVFRLVVSLRVTVIKII